jgi:UDP-N-acetylmuramyl pentapeptide synthase
LLGKRFAGAAKMFDQMPGNMQCFEDLETLTASITQARTPGMTIFLKSSNSIGLSKVEPC